MTTPLVFCPCLSTSMSVSIFYGYFVICVFAVYFAFIVYAFLLFLSLYLIHWFRDFYPQSLLSHVLCNSILWFPAIS